MPGAASAPRRLGSARLVLAHLINTALVALIAAEGRRNEGVDNRGRLLGSVHARAHGDHLRVVVLTGQLSSLHAPRKSGADSGDPVCRQLLAVARAANDHSKRLGVIPNRLGCGNAERGIVVESVVLMCTVVRHLVATRP